MSFPKIDPHGFSRLPMQMQAEGVLLMLEAGQPADAVAHCTHGLTAPAAREMLAAGPFRRGDDYNATNPAADAAR